MQSLVVDAGVVGELVHDGPLDLPRQLGRIREVLLERDPEERDDVGEGDLVRAPLDERRALVEAVQPAVVAVDAAASAACSGVGRSSTTTATVSSSRAMSGGRPSRAAWTWRSKEPGAGAAEGARRSG